jgi:SEC-C motif-containing protein
MRCPCGKNAAYDACCGAFIKGWAVPETAEELMRSRYSAYARGEIDYLVATTDPAHPADRDAITRWADAAEFKKLEVTGTKEGGAADQQGVVEFIALYREGGRDHAQHERSRFRRVDGRWVYSGTV